MTLEKGLHTIKDDSLPVVRKLPVGFIGTPLPRVWEAKICGMFYRSAVTVSPLLKIGFWCQQIP
jgi:hypothetical protein